MDGSNYLNLDDLIETYEQLYEYNIPNTISSFGNFSGPFSASSSITSDSSSYIDQQDLSTINEEEIHQSQPLRKKKGGRKAGSNICHICKKVFQCALNLSRHSRRYHLPIDDNKVSKGFCAQCSICDKIFVDNRSFEDHMNGHEAKRPFACNHCGKMFTLKRNLTRHLRTHAVGDDKENLKLNCSKCDKAFLDPSSLRRHDKKVHELKPLRLKKKNESLAQLAQP